jgi:hypothetical protein
VSRVVQEVIFIRSFVCVDAERIGHGSGAMCRCRSMWNRTALSSTASIRTTSSAVLTVRVSESWAMGSRA